jgi:hypothetical protein
MQKRSLLAGGLVGIGATGALLVGLTRYIGEFLHEADDPHSVGGGPLYPPPRTPRSAGSAPSRRPAA